MVVMVIKQVLMEALVQVMVQVAVVQKKMVRHPHLPNNVLVQVAVALVILKWALSI